jgi:hypothetical protein
LNEPAPSRPGAQENKYFLYDAVLFMLPFVKSREDRKWKSALPSIHPVPEDIDVGNTATGGA